MSNNFLNVRVANVTMILDWTDLAMLSKFDEQTFNSPLN